MEERKEIVVSSIEEAVERILGILENTSSDVVLFEDLRGYLVACRDEFLANYEEGDEVPFAGGNLYPYWGHKKGFKVKVSERIPCFVPNEGKIINCEGWHFRYSHKELKELLQELKIARAYQKMYPLVYYEL